MTWAWSWQRLTIACFYCLVQYTNHDIQALPPHIAHIVCCWYGIQPNRIAPKCVASPKNLGVGQECTCVSKRWMARGLKTTKPWAPYRHMDPFAKKHMRRPICPNANQNTKAADVKSQIVNPVCALLIHSPLASSTFSSSIFNCAPAHVAQQPLNTPHAMTSTPSLPNIVHMAHSMPTAADPVNNPTWPSSGILAACLHFAMISF